MSSKLSIQARKEFLGKIRESYQRASWKDKGKILDGLVAATGYSRKHAVHLLKQPTTPKNKQESLSRKRKYDSAFHHVLLTVWYAANQICSKRFVPFLPELVAALEKFGHLSLTVSMREQLLSISPATVDRLLKVERKKNKKGLSTTKSGGLLKKQIPIRTFMDWSDVVPGFCEADLVAHCGGRVDGTFLNTLVLTDIASGWTELLALLKRSEADVLTALPIAQKLLPFALLGLDTDNGSEFINYELLRFCESQKITFTRSRAYRKNDQAHVEEKNVSIVRRLVGYERYEGVKAWQALAELYATLRLYINFFQPSVKLVSKERQGAKVTKRYDKAKTPYQRLIASDKIPQRIKAKLTQQYESLDPLGLLQEVERLQDQFWQHAWKEEKTLSNDLLTSLLSQTEAATKEDTVIVDNLINESQREKRYYRQTIKPRRLRTWRTRKDPFETVWNQLQLRLEIDPSYSAKALLDGLMQEQPHQFHMSHLRTLQRRTAKWRRDYLTQKALGYNVQMHSF